MGMRVREFAKTVDHTLLKPNILEQDIVDLCEEAAQHHFAAVCVPPCYVRRSAKELRGVDVKVATVISFPFGADTVAVKSAAIRDAIVGGASELDVVMNLSRFLSGDFNYVADELNSLNQEIGVVAMNNGLTDVVMKVIIETSYLNDKMKQLATRIVASSGADFVKTSTGFAPSGATVEDVALLREEAPEGVAVKASGGIRTLQDAMDLLNAGASRLGMSSSVDVMKEAEGGGLQE
ncbi:deoxyribose-phosphate aldolase [soil metagenome]